MLSSDLQQKKKNNTKKHAWSSPAKWPYAVPKPAVTIQLKDKAAAVTFLFLIAAIDVLIDGSRLTPPQPFLNGNFAGKFWDVIQKSSSVSQDTWP